MSVISHVVLVCCGGNDARSAGPPTHDIPIDRVNAFLRGRANAQGTLADLRQHAGGEKVFARGLFAGAFNHLDVESFLEAVASAPWEELAEVQVLIRRQEEDRFTMYVLGTDRNWHQI